MKSFKKFLKAQKVFKKKLEKIILDVLSIESNIPKEEIEIYIEFNHHEIEIILRNKIKSLIPNLETSAIIENELYKKLKFKRLDIDFKAFLGDGTTYYKEEKLNYFENLIEIFYFKI